MPDAKPKRKRKRRPQPPADLLLTPAERFARARARTLELSRQYLHQPEPAEPFSPHSGLEDFSTPDLQLATVLHLHADPGGCPPPYLLFAAHQDVLSEEHTENIREHADDCLLCQILLAELDPPEGALTPAAEARIREQIPEAAFSGEPLPELKPLPPLRRLLLLPVVGLVAVIALMIVAYVAYSNHQSAPDATPAPAQQTAAAPAKPATLYVPELTHIAALPAPTDLPTTTINDSAGVALPTVSDLAPAFQAYDHGDYAAAADRFRSLVSLFPSSEIPSLYLGVSELQLGQNAPAQHDLDKAHNLATSKRAMEAGWYLAVADIRVGLQSEALPLLQSICAINENPHHARACALGTQIEASR